MQGQESNRYDLNSMPTMSAMITVSDQMIDENDPENSNFAKDQASARAFKNKLRKGK